MSRQGGDLEDQLCVTQEKLRHLEAEQQILLAESRRKTVHIGELETSNQELAQKAKAQEEELCSLRQVEGKNSKLKKIAASKIAAKERLRTKLG